jgi:hypothetical protein
MVTSKARKLLGPRVDLLSPQGVGRPANGPLLLHHSTRGALALIALSFGLFPGCANTPGKSTNALTQTGPDARLAWEGDPEKAPWPVVTAAWRDISAAVNWAGSQSGFAVSEVENKSPVARTYHMVGMTGQPATVEFTATRLVEGSLPSDEWITVDVQESALGNREAEAQLREDLKSYRPKYAR